MKRGLRICVLWLMAMCGFATGASAQSVYSLSQFGQRTDAGDIRAATLGGDIITVADSLGVVQVNPAALGYIKRVTFGIGAYGVINMNESQDASYRVGDFKFGTLMAGFRAFSPRVSLGLGFRSRYDATGSFASTLTDSGGVDYVQRFVRSGGLASFPFVAALDLGRAGRVGGYFSVEKGRIDNRWEVDYSEAAYIDAFSEQEYILSGNGWGVGVDLTVFRRMAISGYYEAEIQYDADITETHSNENNNRTDTGSFRLPAKWAASMRVTVATGSTVFAGFSASDFAGWEGFGLTSERSVNESRAAVGFERLNTLGDLPVRVSASWGRLPYALPAGEEVTRFGAAFGTGWKLSKGRGKLDLAIELGRTGSVDTNTLENRYVRVLIGLGGSETWSHERETR